MEVAAAHKKQVRWGTVSVLEFRVGYSSCSVPGSAGPPIGLRGLPVRHSVKDVVTSECEQEDDEEASSAKRTRQDMWICPMERVKILAEEDGFQVSEITAICNDVRTVLDSRSFSKFDHVAHHMLQTLELNRLGDLRKLRESYQQDNRKKIVLF